MPIAADRTNAGGFAVATDDRVQWTRGRDPILAASVARRPTSDAAVRPGLRDLVFDGRGQLFLGTERGLYRWRRDERPERVRLPGANATPKIQGLIATGSIVVVASGSGAYWSSSGDLFQRLDEGAIGASVHRVALRGETAEGLRKGLGGVEVWLAGSRGLMQIRGQIASAGLRITSRTRIDLPLAPGEAEVLDLIVSPDGSTLVLVYPDRLVSRLLSVTAASTRSTSPAATRSAWRTRRPVLAPGAEIRGAAWVSGRLVLATNRGLFEADDWHQPFERVAGPLGASACFDVADDGSIGLVALCRSGVLMSGPELGRARSNLRDVPGSQKEIHPPAPPLLEADPPVEEIRRRAISGAGLSRTRAHGLRAALRRRGYWPEVGLSVEADVDRDERRFADQAFVSGDYRSLRDRTHDRHTGFRATIDFEWQLGEIVYAEDEIDLSRELRQVTSLRDDVVDEIHQLYFERQRIRARLASREPLAADEALALRVRADELWAGLDAWTGGWLSEWRSETRPIDSSPRKPMVPAAPGSFPE